MKILMIQTAIIIAEENEKLLTELIEGAEIATTREGIPYYIINNENKTKI